jgi:hypothetical protein
MDTRRFDALTRLFAVAGSRRALSALLVGALGQSFPPASVADVVASRKRGKGRRKKKRKKQLRPECGGIESPPCPPETPCCIEGTCQPLCGGHCCADCFVEILLTGQPDLKNPICCPGSGGTICSPGVMSENRRKKKKKKKRRKTKTKRRQTDDPSDDLCCYPNETCVNGVCCCDGCQGAVVCGGTCCPIAACCNGACCPAGQVCANTPGGLACVPASRPCGGGHPACFGGEICHGSVCCSGLRVCGNGMGNDFCCGAGEYCEFPGTLIARCCPFNASCGSTYRGRRVRR